MTTPPANVLFERVEPDGRVIVRIFADGTAEGSAVEAADNSEQAFARDFWNEVVALAPQVGAHLRTRAEEQAYQRGYADGRAEKVE